MGESNKKFCSWERIWCLRRQEILKCSQVCVDISVKTISIGTSMVFVGSVLGVSGEGGENGLYTQ